MCTHCGCSDDATPTVTDLQSGQITAAPVVHVHEHGRDQDHDHGQAHFHPHEGGTTIRLDQQILAKNNRLAERNRGWFLGRNIVALNLVSSPGAGKTTLLERTLNDLGGEMSIQVVEGDQATLNDARRIEAAGAKVVQINTGAGCHLDAAMVGRGLQMLDPPHGSVVMIENVGNLVCPALFDLGERAKVLISSVTEGDDKPIKYPHMFRASSLVLLNKIDLLAHVSFDRARFADFVRQVNPDLPILDVSATRGDGMREWYAWLRDLRARQERLLD